MNESNALLSPSEAAKILHVTVGTLAVWRCCRRYPLKFVRVGRKVLYRASDVETFIESRTQPGVPQDSKRRRTRSSRAA
jgi:excisionase family DNA binding protein